MAAGYVFNINNGTYISASNRNNLFVTGAQFATWGGTAYSNLTNLKAATSKDLNSVSVDPQFISAINLHIQNTALKGAGEPIVGITTDIDGDIRNVSTPDIGADEFKLSADAGITQLISPASISCPGLKQIIVVIKNFSSDTLKNATINWTINGVSQTAKSWVKNPLKIP